MSTALVLTIAFALAAVFSIYKFYTPNKLLTYRAPWGTRAFLFAFAFCLVAPQSGLFPRQATGPIIVPEEKFKRSPKVEPWQATSLPPGWQPAAQPAASKTTKNSRPDPAIKDIYFDDKQNVPPHKVAWEITLSKRISKKRLEAIARRLWQPGFEQTFIGYHLGGKSKDNGYWASTHWRKDKVSVLILGLTEETARSISTDIGPDAPKGAKLIGRWRFENLMGHVVIYKQGNQTMLHQRYSDGSGSPSEFKASKHKQGTAYKEVDGSSDFWVALKNGKLQAFDGSGAIVWAVGSPISN